jgi:hypothetical protein
MLAAYDEAAPEKTRDIAFPTLKQRLRQNPKTGYYHFKLEKYKDQIQKECQMSQEATAELDKLVEGQSLIFGAKDELSFRRVLRDIRESGEDDE